jgi:hypothetical protein
VSRDYSLTTVIDNRLEIWGILDFLELSGPVQACTGIALSFIFTTYCNIKKLSTLTHSLYSVSYDPHSK